MSNPVLYSTFRDDDGSIILSFYSGIEFIDLEFTSVEKMKFFIDNLGSVLQELQVRE